MDDESKLSHTNALIRPLSPERVFRPVKKGPWHLQVHSEYGVLWSPCGIRCKQKDCQRPEEPVQIRELCGTCARVAKEEAGKIRPMAEEKP